MGSIQLLHMAILIEHATIEAYDQKREFTCYDPVRRFAVLPMIGWAYLD